MTETPPRGAAIGRINEIAVDLHSSVGINENSAGSTGGSLPVDLQCPATPQHNLKLPEHSNSSIESDEEVLAAVASVVTEEVTTTRNTASPPNCAICLGRCRNKCFTDSCLHQFCFKCLCEWSKVKPECPLCKQIFRSIIHNVKSIDQFEEYHVVLPPTGVRLPNGIDISSFWRGDAAAGSADNIRQGRFRRNSIFIPSSSASGNRHISENVQNQLVHRNELLEMYRQEYPNGIPNPDLNGTLSQLWRRYIYDRKLYALPISDLTGSFRPCTARYYRDNPGQINRLRPWICRDIICLLRNASEADISSATEHIREWLITADIFKPVFRRRLQPILGINTSHFIHELHNFARSPYDMNDYDRIVQYSPRNTEDVVIEFSLSSSSSGDAFSSEDDEDDEALNDNVGGGGNGNNNNARSAVRRTYRGHNAPMINLLSFSISTTSEGVEAPGVSSWFRIRGSQSAAINLSTHNRSDDDDVIINLDETGLDDVENNNNTAAASSNAEVMQSANNGDNVSLAPSPSSLPTTVPTVTENIELSSTTSSDECEFVLERKPPHLRTPEQVSLNSESDSDVIFVQEEDRNHNVEERQQIEMETISEPSTALQQTEIELRREEVGNAEEYNIGASTSTGLRRYRSVNNTKSLQRRKRKLRSNTKNLREYNKTPTATNSDDSDSSDDMIDGMSVHTRRRIREETRRRIRSTTRKSARIKKLKCRKVETTECAFPNAEYNSDSSENSSSTKSGIIAEAQSNHNSTLINGVENQSQSSGNDSPTVNRNSGDNSLNIHHSPAISPTQVEETQNVTTETSSNRRSPFSSTNSSPLTMTSVSSSATYYSSSSSSSSLSTNVSSESNISE